VDAKNFFDGIPSKLPEELFTTLHAARGVRIERIVSESHRSADGFWYDQDQHEWVLVLQGAAAIEFADDRQVVELRPGSYLNIPAHRRHRILWTSGAEQTIWLAVFYDA
jgi:cupin 2 domain-containing protein